MHYRSNLLSLEHFYSQVKRCVPKSVHLLLNTNHFPWSLLSVDPGEPIRELYESILTPLQPLVPAVDVISRCCSGSQQVSSAAEVTDTRSFLSDLCVPAQTSESSFMFHCKCHSWMERNTFINLKGGSHMHTLLLWVCCWNPTALWY